MAKITKISGSEMLKRTNHVPEKGWRVLKDNEFIEVESQGVCLYYKLDEFVTTEDTIFIVNKNADFTEGRGPMRFDSAFRNVDDAVLYILGQVGIYGSKQGVQNYPGININGAPYVVSGFNGYELKAVQLR